jgi:hypothetical protein
VTEAPSTYTRDHGYHIVVRERGLKVRRVAIEMDIPPGDLDPGTLECPNERAS